MVDFNVTYLTLSSGRGNTIYSLGRYSGQRAWGIGWVLAQGIEMEGLSWLPSVVNGQGGDTGPDWWVEKRTDTRYTRKINHRDPGRNVGSRIRGVSSVSLRQFYTQTSVVG